MNLAKVRGPLMIGWLWIWLFPTSWDWPRRDRRLRQAVQVGPVFIDWHDPTKERRR